MTARVGTDDGTDKSIFSCKLEEGAVLNGLGTLTKVETVTVRVALKNMLMGRHLTFQESGPPPRTVLKLCTGAPALVNVTFLIADDQITHKDPLTGRSVLEHLGMDSGRA